jgi:hypothetical protein
VQGDIAMGHVGILNVLMKNYRVSKAANDSESTTMIRLHELQVNASSARQQQYAGMQRRIVSQHNTKTAGHYILTDILKEKSEHSLICPTCNEVDLTTKLEVLV